MNKPYKGITVQDIAKEAGVSPATVSRAVNHRHQVSVSTYDKIQAAMDRLGYETPVESAPRKSDENRVVVVNIPQLGNSVFSDLINGVISSASRYGWYVLINLDVFSSKTKEHMLHILRSSRAVGLIAMNLSERGVLEYLNAEFPVVQCCEVNPGVNIPYVRVDDSASSQGAVEYLISKGYRQIAMLQSDAGMYCARDRQRGYECALAKHNIKLDPSFIIDASSSSMLMIAATVKRTLTTMATIPDAIFASCDQAAYAAITAATELGFRVPEDIAIVGFDNSNLAEISVPKMTSVNMPKFQMGFLSCEILHDQYVNPLGMVRNVTLDTELIIRQSS